MAVVSCDLDNVVADEDPSGFRVYTATYRVKTDARTDGPKTVLDYAGLPKSTNTYAIPGGESDLTASFRGKTVRYQSKDDSCKLWLAECKFSNNPEGGLPARDPEDPPALPWDEPPIPELTTTKGRKPVGLKDLADQLIASSAGEPFDPGLERDETKYILRWVRNILFCDPASNATYRDAINITPAFGCPQYHVKVEVPGAATVHYFAGTKYYRETWEFALSDTSWRVMLIDHGMRRKVGAGATAQYEIIRDLHNIPLTSPTLLDGAGAVLNIAAGANPVERGPYLTYPLRDLTAIGLPQTF